MVQATQSSDDAYENLCREVRADVLAMVHGAGNSGHVGGAFSIVEALVALYHGGVLRHNPQDPLWEERDRLIFSKGHACAALYSVLARAGYFPVEELATFRQLESRLQGHPKAQTQTHGTPGVEFSSGSLGKGLDFAIGEALALKLRGNTTSRVVAILSDGEHQEGETLAAIFSAAKDHGKKGILGAKVSGPSCMLDNLVVVVDANGYQNDGSIEDTCPMDLPALYRTAGWDAIVCADGNNVRNVVNVASMVLSARRSRPTAIILRTVKGKGVPFIEQDNAYHGMGPTGEKYHAALAQCGGAPSWSGSVKPKKRESLLFSRTKGTRDAFGEALVALGAERSDIVVIAADLAKSTAADQFAKAYPRRFFNVGVQEQNAVGIAAGLAAEGFLPFVLTFATFHQVACETILQQLCLSPQPVRLLASHRGLTVGKDGASAQAVNDIGLMRTLHEDMVVVIPADYYETRAAVKAAGRVERFFRRPWYIGAAREKFPVLYDDSVVFTPGLARVHHIGKDATVIACGLMVYFALEAAEMLKGELELGVVNMASVKPLDVNAIMQAATKSGALVTAEEHLYFGGLGEAVGRIVQHLGLTVPLEMVAIGGDKRGSGEPDELLRMAGLTPERIVEAARRAVYRKKANSSKAVI